MDPYTNPFSPGAGSPPPKIAGRDAILAQASHLLARVKQGRPEKSLLLTGLRGVGKTVLLNEIEAIAKAEGYFTSAIEAGGNRSFASSLVPNLRSLLYDLDRTTGEGVSIKRGLAVLKSFANAHKDTTQAVSFGLDVNPEKGTADSGNLDYDLSALFVAIAEAAVAGNTAILVLLDGTQHFYPDEMNALITAMQRIQQTRLPFVFVEAGLPGLLEMTEKSTHDPERIFSFLEIGALSEADTEIALQDPVQEANVEFTDEALTEIYRLTQGYPYLVQEWGYQSWSRAGGSPITIEVVRDATTIANSRLDENFFRLRYDRLPPSEKIFLRGMAELERTPTRMGELATTMSVKIASLGPRRASLIKKGMIYSPVYGEIAFTVPLFDEFMKRAIPQFAP